MQDERACWGHPAADLALCDWQDWPEWRVVADGCGQDCGQRSRETTAPMGAVACLRDKALCMQNGQSLGSLARAGGMGRRRPDQDVRFHRAGSPYRASSWLQISARIHPNGFVAGSIAARLGGVDD